MSRLQILSRKSTELLTQLTQQVRRKTTSEHVLKLRGSGGVSNAVRKSENQIALENKGHMNFRPVPEGNWADYYKHRNTKWSTMLFCSISAFGITVYCMYFFGCLYLHDKPSKGSFLPDPEKTGKILLTE